MMKANFGPAAVKPEAAGVHEISPRRRGGKETQGARGAADAFMALLDASFAGDSAVAAAGGEMISSQPRDIGLPVIDPATKPPAESPPASDPCEPEVADSGLPVPETVPPLPMNAVLDAAFAMAGSKIAATSPPDEIRPGAAEVAPLRHEGRRAAPREPLRQAIAATAPMKSAPQPAAVAPPPVPLRVLGRETFMAAASAGLAVQLAATRPDSAKAPPAKEPRPPASAAQDSKVAAAPDVAAAEELAAPPVPRGRPVEGDMARGAALPDQVTAAAEPAAPPVPRGRPVERDVPRGAVLPDQATAAKPVSDRGVNTPDGAAIAAAPVQQLATAIAETRRMAPPQPAAAAPDTPVTHQSSVVKTLRLQLHPADLGAVTVAMRLSGDAIELRIEAETESAFRLIGRDRQALQALVAQAGYDVGDAQIAVVLRSDDGGLNLLAQPAANPPATPDSSGGTSGMLWGSPRQREDGQATGRQDRDKESADAAIEHPSTDDRRRGLFV